MAGAVLSEPIAAEAGWIPAPPRRPRWRRAAALGALLIGAGLLVLLLHTAFDMMGSRPISALVVADGSAPPGSLADPAALEPLQLLSGTRLLRGNRVEVLADGDSTFDRIREDLLAARRSVTIQHYYCNAGAVADTLAAVLTRLARRGVSVFLLWDGVGCRQLAGSYTRRLRAAGVAVRTFRPLQPFSMHKAQHRSHVRVTVVDGRVGYTGGYGVADHWSARELGGRPPWRDTNVRFEGPAVGQLQAAFAAAWAEATGELLTGESLFPPPVDAREGALAGVLFTTPGVGTSAADRFYAVSLGGARRTLYITNSYFVPSRSLRRMLLEAAHRGVDVRVLTAGRDIDVPLTWYAGRSHYEELLRAGVRIYEFQGAMLHAKTLVADGMWVSIGAMNFDERSVRLNDEASLLVHDPGVGALMVALFEEDLRRSVEITLPGFRRRSAAERLRERAARLISPVL